MAVSLAKRITARFDSERVHWQRRSYFRCLICSQEFPARLAEVNRGNGIVCSVKCFGERRRRALADKRAERRTNKVCATCGRAFYRQASHCKKSKHGFYFCNRACKENAQRLGGIGLIQPPHYGKGTTHSSYRRVAKASASTWQCARCGYRTIPEILQVHHRDRNRKNNTKENLEPLCPTCHEEDHFRAHDGRWGRLKTKRT